ncbi:MAG: hypothetical protein QW797_08175 [Thermoproteota archaeon]
MYPAEAMREKPNSSNGPWIAMHKNPAKKVIEKISILAMTDAKYITILRAFSSLSKNSIDAKLMFLTKMNFNSG